MSRMEYFKRQRILSSSQPRVAGGALVVVLLLVAGLWNVGAGPILWDEGWTLAVARNWVELGHYGQLQAGMPTTTGLAAAFPVVAPIALSFQLLGVGLWQARLVGVLCTLVALAAMYYLAKRLYSGAVAVGTLGVLLLMAAHPQIHPLLMGRVMWAEMPMLFYMVLGYACWVAALRRPGWFVPLAVICWGLGLRSKGQMLPFWALAMLAPLALGLLRRRWKLTGVLALQMFGALALYWLLPIVFQSLLAGRFMPAIQVSGLYEISALVTEPYVRFSALILALALGLPALLGMGYSAWKWSHDRAAMALEADTDAVRLSLLVLAGSWFAWYMLLSSGILRYLLPAMFFSSLFAAALLHDLTDRFNLSLTGERLLAPLRQRRLDRRFARAGLALFLALITVPLTIQTLYKEYLAPPDRSLWQIAEVLNTQIPPDALIETHDAELFFPVRRPYHYPPDQTHVELIRRAFLHQEVTIDYDPLAADPDYLVVGPFNRGWKLYDPVLETGAFRLLHTYGSYDLYERVR